MKAHTANYIIQELIPLLNYLTGLVSRHNTAIILRKFLVLEKFILSV